jgi:hypothetical protein
MATAAPHVKLLRQLASAKDDYLSGAFDISWDGAKATLYLVFGRPSHAVFDSDQAQIEGEAAIDALLAELPRTFAVSDWRRAMSPQETLSISIDELAGPFVRLAGSYADDPVSDESPEWWSADDSSPDLAFGLSDFPLLPGGRPLWAETSPENVNLAERLAELPPSILILTGAKLRAAAVVSGGDLIDAVWIDDEDQARGEAAGMAILGATKGSLAGYALDDPRVAEALTMLWRLPLAVSGIEMSWLDPASMLAAFRADGLDRVLVIDAPVRGIALFSRGGLVAVYSETQRSAVASPERLRSLLSQARGRLTVMERKPRPVAAAAGQGAPSATDFFGVVAPEVAPEPDVSTAEAVETEPEVESHAAEGEHADAEAAVETSAPEVAAPEAETESEPLARELAPDAGTDVEAPEAEGEAEHGTVASPDVQTSESDTAFDATPRSANESGEAAHTDAVADGSAPPPPPPSDADIAASTEHSPPPPAPDAPAEPERKTKRPWWAFGSRKNKAAANQAASVGAAAAEATAAHEAAEAASFAGWSVRKPDPEAQPVWFRSRDHAEGSDHAPEGTEAQPPPAADAISESPAEVTGAAPPAATWSVVEPGSVAPRATSWPATPTAPPSEDDGEAESSREAHPEAGATQASSARDVIADAVGWYQPVGAAHPEATAPVEGEAAPADHTEQEDAGEAAHADADVAPHESADIAAHADVEAAAQVESSDTAPEGDSDESAHLDDGDQQVAAEVDHSLAAWFHPEQVAPQNDEPAATDEHLEVAADGHDGVAGHDAHVAATEDGSDGASATEPVAATGDEPADAAEHDASVDGRRTHDYWAEFASPDPDADADADAPDEVEPDAAAATTREAESPHEPTDESAAEPTDPLTRRPSERTVAPWSWPLAESEPTAVPAPHPNTATPTEEAPEPATTSAHSEPESEDWEPVFEGAGESSFFQRDEPVGSQFVDFDEVRTELVQIGIVWLGEANAVPVTALLRKTRSTIDDFVATIDTIRGLHLEGQDPASVQAMAREMHQQAAERLCGA